MLKENIPIISLPQLKDNYSYLVLKNKKVIIVDPAESTEIIQYIKSNQLNLLYIIFFKCFLTVNIIFMIFLYQFIPIDKIKNAIFNI